MKLVFISIVTTPRDSFSTARAACAMTTSSSVIITPPCSTPHELVSWSRNVRPMSASPRSNRSSSRPSDSTKGMTTGNCISGLQLSGPVL